ncbi:MAG: hypothetical protein ACI8PQ_002954 [Planctomycetota bacterium]|jgi:hypothetical protein
MRHTALPALLILLALGVSAVLILGKGDQPAGGVRATEPTAVLPRDDYDSASAVDLIAPGIEYEGQERADAGETTASTEVAAAGRAAVETSGREGERGIRVRVVDAAGAPLAGFTVVLEDGLGAQIARVQATDARGMAFLTLPLWNLDEVSHAQNANLLSPPDAKGAPGWVRVETLLAKPVQREIGPADVFGPVIEVAVPQHGQLLVHAMDTDGEVFLGSGGVGLGIVEDNQAVSSEFHAPDRMRSLRLSLKEGSVLFPVVALNKVLELNFIRAELSQRTTLVVPGPTVPGERLEVELNWGSDHSVLRFNLLLPDGSSVGERDLHMELVVDFTGFEDTLESEIRSDASGLVQVDLPNNWTEGRTRALELTTVVEDRSYYARIDLSQAYPHGLTVLQDVHLTSPPVFVAGIVVDAGGLPVPDAEIALETIADSDGQSPGNWIRSFTFSLKADGEGRFRMEGEQTGLRFRLTAYSPGLLGGAVEFERGEENLRLELLSGASLAGRFLLNDDMRVDTLRIRLIPKAVTAGDDNQRAIQAPQTFATVAEDASFLFEGLVPGRYDFEVHSGNRTGGAALWALEDIELVRGDPSRPPELNPLDFRELIFAHTLTFVSEEDLSNGVLTYGAVGVEPLTEKAWVYGDTCQFASLAPRVDLVYTSAGFRQVELHGVGGEIEINLVPGPQVRLLFEGDYAPPQAPLFLHPVIRFADADTMSPFDWNAPALDDRRELVLRAPGPGNCTLKWIAMRKGSRVATSANVPGPEANFYIADVPGEQVFTVNLTQADLDGMLKKLN